MHARLSLRRLPARLLLDRPTLAEPRDRHGATGLAPTVTLAYPAAMPERPTPKPSPRCFRLVAHHGEAGPTHCLEPVAWRGSWRTPNGRRYRVEACEGHRPPPAEGSDPTA